MASYSFNSSHSSPDGRRLNTVKRELVAGEEGGGQRAGGGGGGGENEGGEIVIKLEEWDPLPFLALGHIMAVSPGKAPQDREPWSVE